MKIPNKFNRLGIQIKADNKGSQPILYFPFNQNYNQAKQNIFNISLKYQ